MENKNQEPANLTRAQLDALVGFNQARVEHSLIRDDPNRSRAYKLDAWHQYLYSERAAYAAFDVTPDTAPLHVEEWIDRYRSPAMRVLGRNRRKA